MADVCPSDAPPEIPVECIVNRRERRVAHDSPAAAKIELFRSLFRGREDVYPRRFESTKSGRSGYAPGCGNDCFPRAPEICVEVLFPGNSDAEMREKTELYFDAGAKEVWHCSQSGGVMFLAAGDVAPMAASRLCPVFPWQVELR